MNVFDSRISFGVTSLGRAISVSSMEGSSLESSASALESEDESELDLALDLAILLTSMSAAASSSSSSDSDSADFLDAVLLFYLDSTDFSSESSASL